MHEKDFWFWDFFDDVLCFSLTNYKNYLSFIMIDNLISNAKDSDFTLNKNYLGETEFHNTSSNLSLNYISSNNMFDLLYNTNINYNSYITYQTITKHYKI